MMGESIDNTNVDCLKNEIKNEALLFDYQKSECSNKRNLTIEFITTCRLSNQAFLL